MKLKTHQATLTKTLYFPVKMLPKNQYLQRKISRKKFPGKVRLSKKEKDFTE